MRAAMCPIFERASACHALTHQRDRRGKFAAESEFEVSWSTL